MGRYLSGVLVVLLVLSGPARAGELDGIASPHANPSSCPSCHAKVPSTEEAAAGSFSLRGESIDKTCCICHISRCKPIVGEKNHPSDIDRWNREELKDPATLPLYDGRITCLTCHFRNKPDRADYKRVRIVRIEGEKVDWSGLCRDCHSDH